MNQLFRRHNGAWYETKVFVATSRPTNRNSRSVVLRPVDNPSGIVTLICGNESILAAGWRPSQISEFIDTGAPVNGFYVETYSQSKHGPLLGNKVK